jgi:hypothetical protein
MYAQCVRAAAVIKKIEANEYCASLLGNYGNFQTFLYASNEPIAILVLLAFVACSTVYTDSRHAARLNHFT